MITILFQTTRASCRSYVCYVIFFCKRCNQRKGNRTPEEANMPLMSKPARPRYVALVLLRQGRAAESWMKYMY